jgi:hypothetical protein
MILTNSTVEQRLCQIVELLGQLVVLLGGAPTPAAGLRYTIGGGSMVIPTAGPPSVMLVPGNPRRASLMVKCVGPGDAQLSSNPGDRDGFPLFAGETVAYPGLTEPLYVQVTAANTKIYWQELVNIGGEP